MKVVKCSQGVGAYASRQAGFERLLHSHPNGKEWICTAETWAALQKTKGFKTTVTCEPYEPDAERFRTTLDRLIRGFTAMISDPIPDGTLGELQLYLYARPTMRVEYMGRGVLDDKHLPAAKEDLFTLDVAGRGRSYLFRIVRGDPKDDERLKRIRGHWAWWSEWIMDPEAKIVLSFGGGGFRLFGATTVLKVLDTLVKDRSRIGEIWGSSGGALLGYTYAMGYDPQTLESLGYDLYNGRHKHLTSGTFKSLVVSRFNALKQRLRGIAPKSEMVEWLEELDKKQPEAKRRTSRIPVYALATNPDRGGISALAAPEHIPESCKDFIFPCDPRDAVAASTAVPFLLKAQQGITGLGSDTDSDTWVDGSILDENPLTLPYIKWMRERELFPDTTPKRLKVLLVSLNLRSSEVALLDALKTMPIVKHINVIKRIARLVDMAMDSKTDAVIRAVTESPNVEVYSLKLNLGKLHLHDPEDIPAAIRAGASIESWQLTTYRKFV